MLRLLSTVIGAPVISQRDSQSLGVVEEPAVDASTGKVVAYRLSSHPPYVSTMDILTYLDEAMVVQDDTVLQPEDDLVRLQRLGEARTTALGLKAVSDTGKKLGRVVDALVETEGHQITRFHIKPGGLRGLTASEVIIPRERVVKMTNRELVVRYDSEVNATAVEPEIAR